ncbi:MAG: PIN domain-containing protein [Nitrososphaerota archaeon]|jgi:predicted nucleic acid-binding protein|nr:PIN domain-containing protein [Nitrososphaerota archaeon]
MTTFALDTNIVIFLLKEDETVNNNLDRATRSGHELIIPPIVDYEVKRGFLAKRMSRKMSEYIDFCQSVSVGVFDEAVWQKAAHVFATLYQQGIVVDDADVLIAAYCLVNEYTLVTNNKRHFENIDGLKYVDWKE